MTNILLSSAGRRVELARAFKTELTARGLSGKVIATDCNPQLSAACHVADLAFASPRVNDKNYIGFMLDLCKANRVSIVVPTIDPELLVLSQNRQLFEDEGIAVIISDENLVRRCRDKRLTAGLFRQLGIDTPAIYDPSDIRFPCFAKPYDGSCSIGARVIAHEGMMGEGSHSPEDMIFMELIDGTHKEYTVDAYYDRWGRLTCFVPRHRIAVRAGEICKGVTRRNHVYDYLYPKIKTMDGAKGCLTLQLFANENTGRVAAIEINPRFGGGYPLSYRAGANYPGWLIDEYIKGLSIPFEDRWEEDLMTLRYDADIFTHGTG